MRKITEGFFKGSVLLERGKDMNFSFMEDLIQRHPANAFQMLNQGLNDMGLCITISTIEEEPNEENVRPSDGQS